MGLKRPIRGRRELPPWAKAPREGPTSPSRTNSPPWGFSPTWEGEGGWHPSLAYIRRGGVPFFFTTIDLRQVSQISLLSLSPSSSGLPLFGVCTWLGISPPYARRRAAGIGIRIHLLSVARLVRSPEGTSIAPYVCNPARHYTCGATSSPEVFNTTGRS